MVKHKKAAIKSTKANRPAIVKKRAQTHAVHAKLMGKTKALEFDRRLNKEDCRIGIERRQKSTAVGTERRVCERRAKVNRRRQIDPTTCERDYSHDEIEFMNAIEEYKRSSGRMFPTCSEVLEVIRNLGYEKRSVQFVPFTDDSMLVPDITPPLTTI